MFTSFPVRVLVEGEDMKSKEVCVEREREKEENHLCIQYMYECWYAHIQVIHCMYIVGNQLD